MAQIEQDNNSVPKVLTAIGQVLYSLEGVQGILVDQKIAIIAEKRNLLFTVKEWWRKEATGLEISEETKKIDEKFFSTGVAIEEINRPSDILDFVREKILIPVEKSLDSRIQRLSVGRLGDAQIKSEIDKIESALESDDFKGDRGKPRRREYPDDQERYLREVLSYLGEEYYVDTKAIEVRVEDTIERIDRINKTDKDLKNLIKAKDLLGHAKRPIKRLRDEVTWLDRMILRVKVAAAAIAVFVAVFNPFNILNLFSKDKKDPEHKTPTTSVENNDNQKEDAEGLRNERKRAENDIGNQRSFVDRVKDEDREGKRSR